MKCKNIIFDVDGTLLDSRSQTIEAFDRLAMDKIGRHLEGEERDFAFHNPSLETLKALGLETNEENMAELYRHFHDLSGSLKFFPGMKEVLDQIKTKVNFMGMASNRDTDECEYALAHNGLGVYFDDYACRDHVANPKPSGDMLVWYMKKHGLNPADTIYIGNAVTDHMAAIDAGISYGIAEWGTTEYLKEKGISFKEPKDILKICG